MGDCIQSDLIKVRGLCSNGSDGHTQVDVFKLWNDFADMMAA